jgi:hypothetical protein
MRLLYAQIPRASSHVDSHILGILCGRAIQSMAGEHQRFGAASQPLSFDQLLSNFIERMHSEMMFSPSGAEEGEWPRAEGAMNSCR